MITGGSSEPDFESDSVAYDLVSDLGLCGVVKPVGDPYLTMGGGGVGTVTEVDTGTGLTGGPITSSGTISIATTGVTATSYTNADITVNAEGQITAASNGTAGTVTSVATGTGLTGGPITSSGTISMANSTANTVAGYDNSGHFIDVTVGANLSLSGNILSASGGGGSGTVTSVATGTGLTGGPVTTSGTVSMATNTANSLAASIIAEYSVM